MKKGIFTLSLVALLFASCSDDDNKGTGPTGPIDGAVVTPTVGGANQPNQVFVDLSTGTETTARRDSWDLGFSTGSDFRVIINGSIKMAVKQLETSDISQPQEADASVAVGFSTDATWGYVDNPTGVLQGAGNGIGTAIAEISANDEDNKVYLVNLGYEVGTTTPSTGSVALEGDARGWKKIRITRNGNGYTLHYADLDATTAQTINVSKDADFNFTFVSLASGQKVNVQPKKAQWDICFTGFTNYYAFMGGQITYYFADFITTNMLGGTQVYQVSVDDATQTEQEFQNFSLANVEDINFWPSVADQRIIGDSWRIGGGPGTLPSIRDNRFYVVKDTEGHLYKLIFRALTNDAGERGFPVFEYELLQ